MTAPLACEAADREAQLSKRGYSMMRQTILVTAAVTSLVVIAGCRDQAGSGGKAAKSSNASINGSWRLDVNSVQFNAKPDDYLLHNGIYTCKSCTPAYSVAADGAYHPVKMPYFDNDSIKVVDDHTVIESSKKGSKPVRVSTTTVSADGSTSTMQFTDTSRPGSPVEGMITKTRVGPVPAAAHAVSGQWKPSKLSSFNNVIFTYKVSGDMLQFSSPDGTSYEAKIGDGDTQLKGDIAGTSVSVSKVGDNSYQVSFKRDGKVVEINRLTVVTDGKLSGVNENKEDGSLTRWAAYRLVTP